MSGSLRSAEASSIPKDERLRITEIYASIQGESSFTGVRCVFVRLTGCNLRCSWCDSEFTFTGGTHRSIDDVVDEAMGHGISLVEVTGGEPLAQSQCIPLLERLLARGATVLLETSGSLDISSVPQAVHVIMDLKPPDSGECESNLMANLDHLQPHHEVKFVLASRRDYEWARDLVNSRQWPCELLFSPAWKPGPEWTLFEPDQLVAWIMEDGLDVGFQLQLHKVVWPVQARGV